MPEVGILVIKSNSWKLPIQKVGIEMSFGVHTFGEMERFLKKLKKKSKYPLRIEMSSGQVVTL